MNGNFKTRTICIIMSAAVLATLSGCFKLEIKNKETETSISTVQSGRDGTIYSVHENKIPSNSSAGNSFKIPKITFPYFDNLSGNPSDSAKDDNLINSSSVGNTSVEPEKYITETITMKKLTELAYIKGRTVINGDSVSFEWTASGFNLCGYFEGNISVNANVDIGSWAYFEVVVDGKRDKARILGLPLGEAEYYLAQNLKRGYHTVEVTKRTESQFNAVYFNSITYTGRLEKASGKNRKIEFIGDSITCGQGYEVRGQITNYQRSEDGINNYTGQTARALNAEYNVVGLSGWGAFGGGGSDQNRMGRVYEKASYRRKEAANWNFDSWQPDLVVINLGTNDYNYRIEGNAMTPTDYKTEVKKLIKLVSRCNPKAKIVWAYGMMGAQLESEILEALSELKAIDGLDVPYVNLPANWDGGDAHPSKEGHAEAAGVLTEKLKNIMSWN